MLGAIRNRSKRLSKLSWRRVHSPVKERELLGEGAQGKVYLVSVRGRLFALKKYKLGRLNNREKKRDYYALKILSALGFPTVPFPNAIRQGLLMSDLTKNRQFRVRELMDVHKRTDYDMRAFYSYKERQEMSEEGKLEIRLRWCGISNSEELAREYVKIIKKGRKEGIAMRWPAFFLVQTPSENWKCVIADVNEVYIPRKAIPPGIVPDKFMKLFRY